MPFATLKSTFGWNTHRWNETCFLSKVLFDLLVIRCARNHAWLAMIHLKSMLNMAFYWLRQASSWFFKGLNIVFISLLWEIWLSMALMRWSGCGKQITCNMSTILTCLSHYNRQLFISCWAHFFANATVLDSHHNSFHFSSYDAWNMELIKIRGYSFSTAFFSIAGCLRCCC